MKTRHITILILVIGLVITPTQADYTRFVTFVELDSTSLNFYRVTPDADKILVGTLPDFVLSDEISQDKWVIPDMLIPTVSPNRLQIAVVAQRGSEISLFIYDASEQSLRQKMMPAVFIPEWSPNGRYLWLTPCCGENALTNREYIYDIELETLTPVPIFGISRWSPNSDGIVYYDFDGISFIPNDGSNHYPLVELVNLNLPSDTPICGMEWSDFHQRFYYSVNLQNKPDRRGLSYFLTSPVRFVLKIYSGKVS
jgi:hypothetical protein